MNKEINENLKLIELKISRTSRLLNDKPSIDEYLGDDYKNYRKLWENSSKISEPAAEFPIHLDLELGDICNQACVMCPRNEQLHKNNYVLNTKVILDENLAINLIKNVYKSISLNNFTPADLNTVIVGSIFDGIKLLINNLFSLISPSNTSGSISPYLSIILLT